jgi:hypothetical protein
MRWKVKQCAVMDPRKSGPDVSAAMKPVTGRSTVVCIFAKRIAIHRTRILPIVLDPQMSWFVARAGKHHWTAFPGLLRAPLAKTEFLIARNHVARCLPAAIPVTKFVTLVLAVPVYAGSQSNASAAVIHP